jgi:hypothetical protein
MTDRNNPRASSAASTADAPQAPHDDEVYGTLGALLGTLEVVATDDHHPLSAVQSERMRGALRLGTALQSQIEALLVLADQGLGGRLRRLHVALRPLVEHAVRGALRALQKDGVALVLPSAPDWGQQRVFIDSSRVDRTIRALTELLALRVGGGGVIEVSLENRSRQVSLTLRGRPDGSNGKSPHGGLLLQGARRLFELHGGALESDAGGLTLTISLPAAEAP